MKNTLLKIVAFCFLFSPSVIEAQNAYNIRLENQQAVPNKSCYTIQLASATGQAISLAGQNYRLYYDTQAFSFDESATVSLLPTDKYTDMVIKDNFQNIDARGSGALTFDEHLGFINIGNDLKATQEGGIMLPSSGEWVSTATICFNQQGSNSSSTEQLVWARPELTNTYATAYVEIAEWVMPYQTAPLIGKDYFDSRLSTSLSEDIAKSGIKVYPVPTKDKVWLSHETKRPYRISVFDGSGRRIKGSEELRGDVIEVVDLSSFANGMYQLEIDYGSHQVIRKIEKIE